MPCSQPESLTGTGNSVPSLSLRVASSWTEPEAGPPAPARRSDSWNIMSRVSPRARWVGCPPGTPARGDHDVHLKLSRSRVSGSGHRHGGPWLSLPRRHGPAESRSRPKLASDLPVPVNVMCQWAAGDSSPAQCPGNHQMMVPGSPTRWRRRGGPGPAVSAPGATWHSARPVRAEVTDRRLSFLGTWACPSGSFSPLYAFAQRLLPATIVQRAASTGRYSCRNWIRLIWMRSSWLKSRSQLQEPEKFSSTFEQGQ